MNLYQVQVSHCYYTQRRQVCLPEEEEEEEQMMKTKMKQKEKKETDR